MATLVGCAYGGSFFKIDPNNGSGVLIGPIGFNGLNSLARNSTAEMYSVAGRDLIRIDPNTGNGTLVVTIQAPYDIRALAFSPAGALYAVTNGGGLGATGVPDDLVTIDPSTGIVTVIGNTGREAIQALAFAANGTLYAWDINRGLLTINTTTAAATLVNPAITPGSVADIQSIAFSPDGRLFGAREKLYAVDVTNGATTLIGSGGYSDVRGIEFLKEDAGGLRIPPIVRYGWLWMILIGYILITPIGPLCIVCGEPLSGMVVRTLGAISLAIGGLGLMGGLSLGRR
jgi:hypothetical protein